MTSLNLTRNLFFTHDLGQRIFFNFPSTISVFPVFPLCHSSGRSSLSPSHQLESLTFQDSSRLTTTFPLGILNINLRSIWSITTFQWSSATLAMTFFSYTIWRKGYYIVYFLSFLPLSQTQDLESTYSPTGCPSLIPSHGLTSASVTFK